MTEHSSELHVEYDGAVPPLPRAARLGRVRAGHLARLLPCGTHALWFEPRITWGDEQKPDVPNAYLGPFRIEQSRSRWLRQVSVRASADLYLVRPEHRDGAIQRADAAFAELRAMEPEDALRAMQFPGHSYRYYLALSRLEPIEEGLRVHLLTYRLDDGEWSPPRPVFFELPGPDQSLGEPGLFNALETKIGILRFQHLSTVTRVATVEVEALGDCGKPDNQLLWDELVEEGWQVRVDSLDEPKGQTPETLEQPSWQLTDLRRYLSSREKSIDQPQGPHPVQQGHDREGVRTSVTPAPRPWRYSLQAVPLVWNGTEQKVFGFMYDQQSRRGAAVAAHAPAVKGQEKPLLQDVDRLFHRVSLHEFGHMQGLYHGLPGNLMHRAPVLLRPIEKHYSKWKQSRISLRHSQLDAVRLRHFPDIWVRPGGLPFGHRYRPSPVEIEDLIPMAPAAALQLTLKKINDAAVSDDSEFRLALGDRIGKVELSLKKDPNAEIRRPLRKVSPPRSPLSLWLVLPCGQRRVLLTAHLPPRRATSDVTGVEVTKHQATLHPEFVPAVPVLKQVGIYQLIAELIWKSDADYQRVRCSAAIRVEA